jgi:D-xylose transport system ATP-binding protein
VAQTRQVLDLIKRLRQQGLGVVVISHNLEDVFEVCNRVIVLRLGRRVASLDLRTTTRQEVVSAITGADISPEEEEAEAAAADETAPVPEGEHSA